MATNKTSVSDFAWVPAFLEWFRETGNVRSSCEFAGIARSSVYHHRANSKEFAAQFADAEQDAADRLREVARERAIRASDRLLIYLLSVHGDVPATQPKTDPVNATEKPMEELTDADLTRLITEGDGGA